MKSSMTFIQSNGWTEIDLILKQKWRRFIWWQVSFNIYHGKALSYLLTNFTLSSISSVRGTRSAVNNDFTIPRIKGCEEGTFYYNSIKDWNAHPLDLKTTKSKDTFKKRVKEFVLDGGLTSDVHFYWTYYCMKLVNFNQCCINLFSAIHLPNFCDIPFLSYFSFLIHVIILLVEQRTPLEIRPWALMGYSSTNNVSKLLFNIILWYSLW